MKFNLDCARDILFLLEEKLNITPDLEIVSVDLEEITSALFTYEAGEIANTLIVLSEAGFIFSENIFGDEIVADILVARITYNGYQFLESIRPEPVWQNVKAVGSKVGSFSVNAISQIATNVITSLINAQLCL